MFSDKCVSIWNKFRKDSKGSVATLFGLALIPMMFFTGAAIDYSRLVQERTRFQAALDAAALSIANSPSSVPVSELQARAEKYFAASFRNASFGSGVVLTVSRVNSVITLSGSADVDMTIMKVAGYDTMKVGASASVTAGGKKIEIALVLDNTGSMDKLGKMAALKASVNDLINGLQAKVVNPGDVKLSIVPFNTEVRIDPGHFNAAWLRWDVTLENTSLTTSERQPPLPADWTGCLADRDQPHDASSVPAGIHETRYVAAKCHVSSLAKMEPLTSNLETIRTRSQSMTPQGYTNIAIGYTMGLAALRPDSPFGAASSAGANVEKYMIVLTDGDNTRNRWSSNATTIDARLSAACAQAKASVIDKKVKVYTIRVIEGNASLLQSCASDPSLYFNVTDASGLQPVFQKILKSIQGTRITS